VDDIASRLNKGHPQMPCAVRLRRSATVRKPFNRSANTGNESKIVLGHIPVDQREDGAQMMSREAVLENVRRFRAIASLYRQTAAFRPGQSWSLLGQAKDWEYRALAELETYFKGSAQRTVAQLEIGIAA
jgi:hypothetical protein